MSSVRLVGWAMERPCRTPEAKLLLMLLCGSADGRGYISAQGVEIVHGQSGLSPTKLVGALNRLRLDDAVRVTADGGVLLLPPPRMRLTPLRCIYCDAPAHGQDHVVPRAEGGTDGVNNLVPACRDCNRAKGTHPVDVFLQDRPERLDALRNWIGA